MSTRAASLYNYLIDRFGGLQDSWRRSRREPRGELRMGRRQLGLREPERGLHRNMLRRPVGSRAEHRRGRDKRSADLRRAGADGGAELEVRDL